MVFIIFVRYKYISGPGTIKQLQASQAKSFTCFILSFLSAAIITKKYFMSVCASKQHEQDPL